MAIIGKKANLCGFQTTLVAGIFGVDEAQKHIFEGACSTGNIQDVVYDSRI
jgi:hypothetical protein